MILQKIPDFSSVFSFVVPSVGSDEVFFFF